MIESPSQDPWAQRFYHRLQYETVPVIQESGNEYETSEVIRDPTLNTVENAIHGDMDAVGCIYEIYNDRLVKFCWGKVGSFHDAEDCAQEVWLRVIRNLPKFESRRDIKFDSYLFSAAHHICIDHWRAQKQEEPLPDAEEDTFRPHNLNFKTPEEIVIEREEIEDLSRAVRKLVKKSPESALVVASRLEGYSNLEIGLVLGQSNATVRQKVSRGLKKIRVNVSPE